MLLNNITFCDLFAVFDMLVAINTCINYGVLRTFIFPFQYLLFSVASYDSILTFVLSLILAIFLMCMPKTGIF